MMHFILEYFAHLPPRRRIPVKLAAATSCTDMQIVDFKGHVTRVDGRLERVWSKVAED